MIKIAAAHPHLLHIEEHVANLEKALSEVLYIPRCSILTIFYYLFLLTWIHYHVLVSARSSLAKSLFVVPETEKLPSEDSLYLRTL